MHQQVWTHQDGTGLRTWALSASEVDSMTRCPASSARSSHSRRASSRLARSASPAAR